MTGNNGLPVWVVYRSPGDYPGKWVLCRQWANAQGVWHEARPVAISRSYEEILGTIPPTLTRMPIVPRDVPCIHEVWI